MVFRGAAHLAEFYTELVAAVSRFSLQLTADDTLQVGPGTHTAGVTLTPAVGVT